MKKLLGIILSIIFSSIFFGIFIYDAGLEAVLMALGETILVVGAIVLCLYLLED